jgi:hypothetical protein
MRDEHRMRVTENKARRRTFGGKRNVRGGWIKLHSEEFHNLNCLPNIIRTN